MYDPDTNEERVQLGATLVRKMAKFPKRGRGLRRTSGLAMQVLLFSPIAHTSSSHIRRE